MAGLTGPQIRGTITFVDSLSKQLAAAELGSRRCCGYFWRFYFFAGV
jgi:hypothetical protein